MLQIPDSKNIFKFPIPDFFRAKIPIPDDFRAQIPNSRTYKPPPPVDRRNCLKCLSWMFQTPWGDFKLLLEDQH